jgi:hypothetical protein
MSTPEQKIEEFKQQFPDIADAVQAVVNQGISSKLKPIQDTVEADRQARFNEALIRAVPDWEAIVQADPRWPAWLAERAPYVNRPRLELLREAIGKSDSESVIHLLEDFKRSPTAGSPGGGTPPPQQQRNLISRKSVKDFYSARAQGYYRGREKEARDIEAQINQAMLEGRIV